MADFLPVRSLTATTFFHDHNLHFNSLDSTKSISVVRPSWIKKYEKENNGKILRAVPVCSLHALLTM
jgi:hypothetical protein